MSIAGDSQRHLDAYKFAEEQAGKWADIALETAKKLKAAEALVERLRADIRHALDSYEQSPGTLSYWRVCKDAIERVLADPTVQAKPCVVSSSVTGQPCELREGHPAWSAIRFHKFSFAAEQTARAEAAEKDRDLWRAASDQWEQTGIEEMAEAQRWQRQALAAEAERDALREVVGRLRAFVTRIRDWAANVDGSELLSEDLDAAVSIFEDAQALLAAPPSEGPRP